MCRTVVSVFAEGATGPAPDFARVADWVITGLVRQAGGFVPVMGG